MLHVGTCEDWRRVKEAELVVKEGVGAVVRRRKKENSGQFQNRVTCQTNQAVILSHLCVSRFTSMCN